MTELVIGWIVVGALTGALHFIVTVSPGRFMRKVAEHLLLFVVLAGLVGITCWKFNVKDWDYVFVPILVTSASAGWLAGAVTWFLDFRLAKPPVSPTTNYQGTVVIGGTPVYEMRRNLFEEGAARYDESRPLLVPRLNTNGRPVIYVKSEEGLRYERAVEASQYFLPDQPIRSLTQILALYNLTSDLKGPKPGEIRDTRI